MLSYSKPKHSNNFRLMLRRPLIFRHFLLTDYVNYLTKTFPRTTSKISCASFRSILFYTSILLQHFESINTDTKRMRVFNVTLKFLNNLHKNLKNTFTSYTAICMSFLTRNYFFVFTILSYSRGQHKCIPQRELETSFRSI